MTYVGAIRAIDSMIAEVIPRLVDVIPDQVQRVPSPDDHSIRELTPVTVLKYDPRVRASEPRGGLLYRVQPVKVVHQVDIPLGRNKGIARLEVKTDAIHDTWHVCPIAKRGARRWIVKVIVTKSVNMAKLMRHQSTEQWAGDVDTHIVDPDSCLTAGGEAVVGVAV